MKKIITIIVMLFGLISFSVNGSYSANYRNSEMSIIIKNNKIIAISFDKKDESGKSLKFVDDTFAEKVMEISSEIRKNGDISERQLSFDKETNKEFIKLFNYLKNKIKNGEVGNYTL